jgi:subtilisin family serine protease
MFYNPDGSAITPGNFSSSGGRVLQKPDFTAADGVTTTPPGFAPFFGTSAAAPHAAAIAALVLSYNPTLTPAQVRNVLTNSCIDIMAPGWDRDSGYGILMASAALQNTPPPTASPRPFFVAGSLKYLSTGQFQATLAGVVGSNYNILISSDLQTWTTLTTLTMTTANSVFLDTTASPGARFYRAELAP